MPRKGENIYKRKDGRWEGRYKLNTNDGKTKYGYIYGRSYSEVKKELSIRRAEQMQSSMEKKVLRNENFNAIAILWLADIKPTVKISTWNKYKNLLNSYIIPALNNTSVGDIDYSAVSLLVNNLLVSGGARNQGLSTKTVSDVLVVLKAILKYAARMKITVDLSAFEMSVSIKSTPLKVISVQDQKKIINHLSQADDLTTLGILICLFTGMRIGEVCALTWGDISIDNRIIHVHQTIQRVQYPSDHAKTKVVITEPKSQCSIRDIPIPDILITYLTAQVSQNTAFVLTGSDKIYLEPRTMQNRFKKILLECGIETMNFHVLRHTFATRCIEVGFDIKSLSEILGHANVNITLNRYVHPSMKTKHDNMAKLSEIFSVK